MPHCAGAPPSKEGNINKNTRWKRRILREHRACPDLYVHEVFLVNLTQPRMKYKASIGGFRKCARCGWAKDDMIERRSDHIRGVRLTVEPIIDEATTGAWARSWADIQEELQDKFGPRLGDS